MAEENEYLLNCRLCGNLLGTDRKIYIFDSNSSEDKGIELRDSIYTILGIHILESDNLPRVLCVKCNCMINSIQRWKKKCLEADTKLRQTFPPLLNVKQESIDVTVKVENDEEEIQDTSAMELVSVSLEPLEPEIKVEEQIFPDIRLSSLHPPLLRNNKQNLLQSRQRVHKISTLSSSKVVVNKKRVRISKRTICEICGVFSKRLGEHMLVHSKIRFSCTKCPNTYARRTALGKHMLTHSDKKYLCEYCEMRFSCHAYLKKHLLVHTGERNHVCDICKKAFQTKYNLNTHMRIHTKEKPFKCVNCDLAFAHRATFNIHSRKCIKE